MSRRFRAIGLSCVALACGSSSEPSGASSTSSQLPPGFAARAGRELISVASVTRIADAQGLPLPQALSRAVSDALFAEGARSAIPLGTAAHISRAATARGVLEQVAREATWGGPPSEAELSELLRERWVDLDRPDAARTSHAVVIVKKPEQAALARRVAERLLDAVKPAASTDEFERLAKTVALDGLELRVESVPAVTSDGRGLEQREGALLPRGTFDPAFARAANALLTPGQLSPVTQSEFGFHVIRLEERVPGRTIPKEQRASLLGKEVLTRRAAKARRELLERLRRGVTVEIDRGVDELTGRLRIAP